MKYVIVSGYFNPIHSGHLDYLKEASKLGHHLIVIINNDKQAVMKHGYSFINEEVRQRIVGLLEDVDMTFISIDEDRSVCKTIDYIYRRHHIKYDDEYIFANGGDQTNKTIPETETCKKLGIKMIFGVGGNKTESSSNILENYYQWRRSNE